MRVVIKMLFRLVETIEFPAADCENCQESVSIIVNALHRAGVIKNTDRVHWHSDGLTVKVYVYRREDNGHG